ncbi:MAG: hypothetical protein ABIO46_11645 [Chitinophagales bacterium]
MKLFIRYTLAFSLVSYLVFLASCAKDKAAEPTDIIDTVACIQPGQTITYTGDIKRIMETYCTDKNFGTCHQSELDSPAGTPGLDYTTYAGIKEKVLDGQLIARVFDPSSSLPPMPPLNTEGPQTLTDCDYLKLQAWVDSGAQE